MSTYSGKAVLITGAGKGIGYALCQAFASAGAIVALNDIDLRAPVRERPSRSMEPWELNKFTPMRVTSQMWKPFVRCLKRFVDTAGRLDIAIANAGITNYGGFLTCSPEAFDRLTSVNLRGSFLLLPKPRPESWSKRHVPGRII